jgi:hypothetical protein
MASTWLILQAIFIKLSKENENHLQQDTEEPVTNALKKFPVELIVVFFYCFSVTILSTIVCLVMESYPGAGSLKPTMRLIAVLYSVCSEKILCTCYVDKGIIICYICMLNLTWFNLIPT